MRIMGFVLMSTVTLLIGCRTNESPKGQVDDLQITAQVKSKLAADIGASSVTDISVNSTNGVVTLSGQVDSANTRTKVEAVTRTVPKVVRVINALQLTPKPQSEFMPARHAGVPRIICPLFV